MMNKTALLTISCLLLASVAIGYHYENNARTGKPDKVTDKTIEITGLDAKLTNLSTASTSNLTGVITSVGNATSIASQTGTGTKFVVDTSPTIITPTLSRSGMNGAGEAIIATISSDAKTANDGLILSFSALDSGNAAQTYGSFRVLITDPTAGSESSKVIIRGYKSGATAVLLTLESDNLTLPGSIKISTNATACSSAIRGTIRYTAGAAGVADKIEACVKSAADAYAWLAIYTAP